MINPFTFRLKRGETVTRLHESILSETAENENQANGSLELDYQEVADAASSGDSDAFEELIARFQHMAYVEALRWLDCSDLAEDAVQEAFIIVFLKLSQLKNPGAFPSWLRKIVQNCCLRIRKQERLHWFTYTGEIGSHRKPSLCPSAQIERYQTRTIVAETLNTLDGVAREACIQRYILGRPCKSIAASLQIPVGTVKRRLHDAKSRLITMLKSQGEPVICVGYLPITDHLLAMVSHYLNRSSLEIRLKRFLSWASLEKAIQGGILDAAFVMAPMAMSLRNRGVSLVYVMDAHKEGSAITVRRGLHLKHKRSRLRMGLPHAISTHSVLLSEMDGNMTGSSLSDIQLQFRGPSYLPNSLVSSEIDGFFCAEPWNTKAAMDNGGIIIGRTKDLFPGHICCILVVMEEFLRKSGDLVQSYLRLLVSANRYLSRNPHQCAKIQELYTGVPASINEKVLCDGDISFSNLMPDRSRIKDLMELALAAGVLESPCDLDTFIAADNF